MKNFIKFTVTLVIIGSIFFLFNGILDHYSIKHSKQALKYERLYNSKVSTYASKKSDLSYYRSGLYVKKVAQERYGFIDPNDDPALISYSKVYTDEKNTSLTVILDLFTTSLSADELKTIYPY